MKQQKQHAGAASSGAGAGPWRTKKEVKEEQFQDQDDGAEDGLDTARGSSEDHDAADAEAEAGPMPDALALAPTPEDGYGYGYSELVEQGRAVDTALAVLQSGELDLANDDDVKDRIEMVKLYERSGHPYWVGILGEDVVTKGDDNLLSKTSDLMWEAGQCLVKDVKPPNNWIDFKEEKDPDEQELEILLCPASWSIVRGLLADYPCATVQLRGPLATSLKLSGGCTKWFGVGGNQVNKSRVARAACAGSLFRADKVLPVTTHPRRWPELHKLLKWSDSSRVEQPGPVLALTNTAEEQGPAQRLMKKEELEDEPESAPRPSKAPRKTPRQPESAPPLRLMKKETIEEPEEPESDWDPEEAIDLAVEETKAWSKGWVAPSPKASWAWEEEDGSSWEAAGWVAPRPKASLEMKGKTGLRGRGKTVHRGRQACYKGKAGPSQQQPAPRFSQSTRSQFSKQQESSARPAPSRQWR